MMRLTRSQWCEYRVIIPGRHVFLPYYTTNPWGVGEKEFLFFSALPDFSQVWFGFYSPDTGISMEHELVDWAGRPADRTCAELLCAVPLPARRTLLLPRGPELYQVDYSGGKAVALPINAGEGMRFGGPGTRSADGELAAFGVYSEDAVGGTPAHSRVVVFDTAEFNLIGEYDFGDFFANHFQFMSDSDWLLFAHEGPTEEIGDRINRLNWRTGQRELLHAHPVEPDAEKRAECIGHEMTAADVVCAVRYPVSRLPGALLVMNADGSDCTVLDCDDYWHSSLNAAGSVFAMDTMWWGDTVRKTENKMDIIRIDRIAGTKEIVKTVSSRSDCQFRHPHPQLNATGKRLLFIEDADPSGQFGSVTLCELRRGGVGKMADGN